MPSPRSPLRRRWAARAVLAVLAGPALALPLLDTAAAAQETPRPSSSARPVASARPSSAAPEGQTPTPRATGLFPVPVASSPTAEPESSPEETLEPEPVPTPSPSPTRRRRSSPSPTPVPTLAQQVVTPTPEETLDEVLVDSTPASPPPPIELDRLQPDASPSAAAAAAPAPTSDEEPADPVGKIVKTALATAFLLGVLGVGGLYLTRDQR